MELRQLWETRPPSDGENGHVRVEDNLDLSPTERLLSVVLVLHFILVILTCCFQYRKLLAEIRDHLGTTFNDCLIDADYVSLYQCLVDVGLLLTFLKEKTTFLMKLSSIHKCLLVTRSAHPKTCLFFQNVT